MKPTTDALQVFYGTIPLVLVLLAAHFRSEMLLKDILARLGRLEAALAVVREEVNQIKNGW